MHAVFAEEPCVRACHREPSSARDSSPLGLQSILTVAMIAAVVAATVAVYGVRMSIAASTTSAATKAAQLLLPSPGASEISYLPGGTGAVTTNVQVKLRESVSARDYGADAPGDVSKQMQNALNGAQNCALVLTPGHS